ncbi:MAG: hypothetical protein JRI54_09210 [Deltaproteobacteria bacterium]|nr:hypothetical protein [Deltaproteobacteria bacterium]
MSESIIIRSADSAHSSPGGSSLKNTGEAKTDTDIKPETLVEYTFTPLTDAGGTPAMTFAKAQKTMEQAKETLAQAQKEAEAIKALARKEGEEIKEKARAEGFEKGREQGINEGMAQGQENFKAKLIETWNVLDAIGNLYQDLKKANEVVLVKLALTVAERVLLHEVSTSPEVVAAAFKAALAKLDKMHEVTLRAHPDDLARLEAAKAELKDQPDGLIKITIQPDPALNRGDLVAETEAGRIDATLRRRLQAVIEAVDEELKKNLNLDW